MTSIARPQPEDVQRVFRLLAEVWELRDQRDRQRQRVRSGLGELVGVDRDFALAYRRPVTRRLAWFLEWVGEEPSPAAESADDRRHRGRNRRLLRLFVSELYRLHRSQGPSMHGDAALPPRRRQVLEGVLQGKGSKQIAWSLGVSRRTVDEHLCALYKQFNVRDRTGLLTSRIADLPRRPVAAVPHAARDHSQPARPTWIARVSPARSARRTLQPLVRGQMLRMTEVRRVYRIFDEARELGGHTYAARRHMVFELCRLVHARQAFYACLDGFTPWDLLSAREMVIGGWPDEQGLRSFHTWAQRGMLREDPLVRTVSFWPDRSATVLREQIATDRQWRASKLYEYLAGPNGVEDMIIAYVRRREPGRVVTFALHRGPDERRFTLRERRLVQLFNDEFNHRYIAGDPDIVGPHHPPSPLLAPRQRQVLEEVLQGHSTAKIAQQLNLSRRTLEQYIQALFEKFRVDSRFALMAHFARPL